jgi:hypothetical protein
MLQLVPALEDRVFICCFMVLWVSTVGLLVLMCPKFYAFYLEMLPPKLSESGMEMTMLKKSKVRAVTILIVLNQRVL